VRRPIRFPTVKGPAAQQQINRLRQPLLDHRASHLIGKREEPAAMLETVAVIFLVLYNAVERYEFTRG